MGKQKVRGKNKKYSMPYTDNLRIIIKDARSAAVADERRQNELRRLFEDKAKETDSRVVCARVTSLDGFFCDSTTARDIVEYLRDFADGLVNSEHSVCEILKCHLLSKGVPHTQTNHIDGLNGKFTKFGNEGGNWRQRRKKVPCEAYLFFASEEPLKVLCELSETVGILELKGHALHVERLVTLASIPRFPNSSRHDIVVSDCRLELATYGYEPNHLIVEWKSKLNNDVTVYVDKQRKMFHWVVPERHSTYRIDVPFFSLKSKVDICPIDGHFVWLTFELQHPPKIYKLLPTTLGQLANISDKDRENMRVARYERDNTRFFWSKKESEALQWFQTVDFTGEANSLGRCLVHRLCVRPPTQYSPSEFWSFLGEYQLFADSNLNGGNRTGKIPESNKLWKRVDYDHPIRALSELSEVQRTNQIAFPIRYALACLITSGRLSPYTLLHQLDPVLVLLSRVSVDVGVRVLEDLRQKPRIHSLVKDLESVLNSVGDDAANVLETIDRSLMRVRRVIVTPTRTVCMPYEIETSNRVLRHFSCYGDRFIRVSFCDENLNKLGYEARSGDVMDHVKKILRKGLTVANRSWEFLGYSQSQLRQHSAWFFSPVPGLSTEQIRQWMGDFKCIKSRARYAARMGQCFSSTQECGEASDGSWVMIDDVMRGGYCFTDGAGLISRQRAREVAMKLELNAVPSAYQVRFAGCKGILAVDYNGQLPPGVDIGLRGSMKKFESVARELEVVMWSRWLPAYLNRPLVTLLETLGIHKQVFVDMQQGFVQRLDEMLHGGETAMRMLLRTGGENATSRLLLSMIHAKFKPDEEIFLKLQLQACKAAHLLDIQKKARVLVDEGMNAIGVPDPTGLLQPGQIFLQYRKPDDLLFRQHARSQYVVEKYPPNCMVVGRVMVTRSPMLHPGDVRVFEAVDIPELRDFYNVIVFPVNGTRPHADEMSGGDLDGDLFMAVWDQRLIPLQPDQPANYPAKENREQDKEVSIDDVKEFFADYMVMDNLGTIASAHLAHADREPQKTRSKMCLELARLHASAVDFAKSGIRAPYDAKVFALEAYPDFMEKDVGISYQSRCALGLMYQSINAQITWDNHQGIRFDNDLFIPHFRGHIDEAKRLRDEYEYGLYTIMTVYGIQYEQEAVSGSVSKFLTQDSDRPYDRRQKVRQLVLAHRQRFRALFFSDIELADVGGSVSSDIDPEYDFESDQMFFGDDATMKSRKKYLAGGFPCTEDEENERLRELEARQYSWRKASTWYLVCYHPDIIRRDKTQGWVSFPWVVYDVLCEIKALRELGWEKF